MLWANSPSSVIRTKPVVSLSSLPAGKRPFLFRFPGRISITVISEGATEAETTPFGLFCIIVGEIRVTYQLWKKVLCKKKLVLL